ncbi:Nitrate/nitrite transporter NarK [Saccharopolyspora kobensis]|uniref:Nitrate/nitrite transporter NarK n=1 Tax=Saccharopolyspora kobensis TaxID=146035 RepID=A0A1H5W0I7_9PSEU|nr:MFS transporter [Saccharopolyspora kobensis]SEF92798.1 Nitrate/nitrite transporter NarK [Saccharopolyspora kobensis]SFD71071.1 Nitrate/nitrite transporter NarK [Saccharopolyspora kobensis]
MIGLHTPGREVRDHHGRRYRLGEHPSELIGRSRSAVLWLCWLPMLLVGTMQYAYGSLVPGLVVAGLARDELFWALAGWAVCQAGAGLPAAHLRQRNRIGPRTALVVGAFLSAGGVLSLAHSASAPGLLVGYSVLGGTGAGLVYAACTSTAGKWFPERAAARVGFVTGAFAYGSVPFVLWLPVNAVALDAFAVALLVAVLGCGLLLADPPKHWWPAHVDPRRWALTRPKPPAVREFSALEALRTPTLPVLAACLFCAATASLFDAAFLALHAGVPVFAVFIAINGAGRALAIPVADRIGCRRTLGWVVAVQAAGQVVLLVGVAQGSVALLLAGAAAAGVGGGACYPLSAALAREYFGEHSVEVHGLVYSAKAASGVVGIGLGAVVIAQWGFPVALLGAAALALSGAVLCGALRRPGLPKTLPSPDLRADGVRGGL